MTIRWPHGLLLALAVIAASCGSDAAGRPAADTTPDTTSAVSTAASGGTVASSPETEAIELFPDVVDVALEPTGDGVYTVRVTLSSPYDTPARYADAWQVLSPDGTVLGTRELSHDHQAEQPFTRSLSAVEIPTDIAEVTVQGRDQVSGWGGATMTAAVPR